MALDAYRLIVAGQLEGLQEVSELDLSGQGLWGIPPAIGQLIHLRRLRLNDNVIIDLPSEIGQLIKLQQLTLDGNQLTSLPAEIGQLTKLQQLTLSDNRLPRLPSEIGRLTKLRRLILDAGWLSELPSEIGRLIHLEELAISKNGLTRLPSEIGQLANLQRLALDANRLSDLPPEIGRLIHLRQLQLGNNKLTRLPRELVNLLASGMVMGVAKNPLREPFPELIGRGTAALITYFRSLDDAILQYEAKILFVGEGNVGKTSLVAALQNDPFVDGRDTTHGIEIRPLTLQHPDLNVPMTLRTWDFGGQEVYRVTHQFFFSRRALYLVVWNSREGQEQNEVEGWLRRIRLRIGSDVPVLIVATHCEERRPELDYPSLQREFSKMLVGHHAVDNRNSVGIVPLRERIAAAAAQLPQMGQLFSLRWAATRDEVLTLARTEPQITHNEFVATCRRHHLADDEVGTLTELLHDLGQILYYGDDDGLRDIIVLNPEWLTKAISYVLEDESTRHNQGVLDHARLKEIWQNRPDGTVYPLRFHPYFLRLMEKFDVSYRLEDDDQKSLVAQLVPYERPETPWNVGTPAADSVRTLSLICRLSEPAPGLVAWLTVRLHRASTGKHWRTGVFLRHPIGAYESEALLELRDNRHLVMEVRAPSPDLFFNVVRETVENLITHRWPGLTYQLWVPG